MKTERAGECNQRYFSSLTRLGLACSLLIAMLCAGPSSLAQRGLGNGNGKGPKPKEQSQIGTIGVDASDSSALLDVLSRDYSIVPLDAMNPPAELSAVLIGPGALNDQEVVAYLVHVYAAGLTVGILNATQDQMDRFDALVEGFPVASCEPALGESQVALYGIQRALQVLPPEVARYCVPSLDTSTPRARKADADLLGPLFTPRPPSPPIPSTNLTSANAPVNLETLSQKINCTEITSNKYAQMHQDLYITSLRSFSLTSPRDYYYVEKSDQFRAGVGVSNYYFTTTAGQPTAVIVQPSAQSVANYLDGTRILFSEPESVKSYVDSYTNSQSTSVSGSVGFQGLTPNVSVEVGVTIGKSTTVSVPAIQITNTTNLIKAIPNWFFYPASPSPEEKYGIEESWVWAIDRNVYPQDVDYVTAIATQFGAAVLPTYLFSSGQCVIPTPFSTWEIGAPHISSVEPASTFRGGGTFIIHGEQLYPGIISNVLLGGDPLPPSNFVPIDDKSIRVVVPGSQKLGLTPVQVNTIFNGQTQFSNSDVMVKIQK